MNHNSKLLIATAGSGKTTFLINKAIEDSKKNILITTYTQANADEIHRKFIKILGYLPKNVTIQTWFSFLIQHGVKPFQSFFCSSLFDYQVEGLLLVNEQSAIKYKKNNKSVFYAENELVKHYFSAGNKIYSDKLSKFVSGGGNLYRKTEARKVFVNSVLNRLSRIYDAIYIDEIQDLAGYDLEIIKLFLSYGIELIMVGDPRQVTYLTHHESKYKKYRDGKILDFFNNECSKIFSAKNIDTITLQHSHRNNGVICDFSSKLYPELSPSYPCSCTSCREPLDHQSGIFLVKKEEVGLYVEKVNPVHLRWDKTTSVNENLLIFNFGESKGLGFDHVLIYPTKPIIKWIKNNDVVLSPSGKAKFYVAITRAKHSVGIVWDDVFGVSDIPFWIGY